MFKKIILIILGIALMIFGLYGLIVWWWPLFVQVFLGSLGFIIGLIGLALFVLGWTTEISSEEDNGEDNEGEEENREN